MPLVNQINLVAANPENPVTANGASSDQTGIGLMNGRFLLAVTTASGTNPTLNVYIQGKTLSGNYVTIAQFTQMTTVGSTTMELTRIPRLYRIAWIAGGTSPSFTFEVDLTFDAQP
jgi:hypothetical protein